MPVRPRPEIFPYGTSIACRVIVTPERGLNYDPAAVFIGLPILLYTTRKLLRSLIGVNRLVWTAHVPRASPTVAQTFGFLAILTAFPALSAVAAVARAEQPGERRD